MSEIRWHEALQDITKVEYKYNIKNPLWDSEGWEGVFREYGLVPVDAKGEWWTRIPGSPEIPIICAPLVTTSTTTAGAVAGTTSTALIETATPIIDVAYTEIAGGGATATVTTGGAVTSVSSAVATGAIGAAIGFGVGLGGFELAPEFWTKISNAVFGTDLDPNEIGQMTKDTNALAIVKDGIVYMAEDMVNAIRNAFFDNGAADESIQFPPSHDADKAQVNIEFSSYGNFSANWGIIDSYLYGLSHAESGTRDTLYQLIRQQSTGYGYAIGSNYENGRRVDVYYFENNYEPLELPATYPFTQVGYNGNVWKCQLGGTNNKFRHIYIVANPTSTYVNWYQQSYDSSWTAVVGYGFDENGFMFGTINQVIKGSVDGITPTGEQGTKEQPLSTVFPNWSSKAIETIAGDGETKVRWLPVSLPADNPLVNGNSFTTEEAQEGILPDDDTETLGQVADNTQEVITNTPNYPTPPIPPEPIVTPTPDSPILVGAGAASIGLANLYNPTLAQLKEFSRWLWGTDFDLEQLKKLFQDPMQAIIGLHVLYATPTTGAEKGIQLGYINSGVNSKTVTEQYIDIDCGTVTINEYFGDARDYSPFTQVFCYLPFIGIVELNADDVISSNLTIKYRIDVLTGCCLAELAVKKFGVNAVLYTYTGNCAVQMPITSGSYLSTITSLLGAVVGVVGGALTGGVAGAVSAGVYGASHIQKASVSMSGSLGSNAGAMGIRKPYIIIKRVEEADASGYNEFYGYPTNRRVLLSELSGFVRVKDINLTGVTATEEEQAEIITLLKEGIII